MYHNQAIHFNPGVSILEPFDLTKENQLTEKTTSKSVVVRCKRPPGRETQCVMETLLLCRLLRLDPRMALHVIKVRRIINVVEPAHSIWGYTRRLRRS